jgi:hypothetical protein
MIWKKYDDDESLASHHKQTNKPYDGTHQKPQAANHVTHHKQTI